MPTFKHNTAQVLSSHQQRLKQAKFAMALALTETARMVRDAMPAEAAKALDQPTPFTRAGFYSTRATRDKLECEVGIKTLQAKYLRWQVKGGIRSPARKALRLPSVVELNQYGNMPAGLVRQLVARAKAGRRATKTQARKYGVSQQVDLFYGEPGDGRPAGIYKRVVVSSTQHRLIPVVVFPKRSARYSPRFDFYGIADRAARREFAPVFARAWRRAIETAR